MAKQFGITWWGKKWLDSLKQFDLNNSLNKGKTYANNDNVLGIKISGNQIISKVKGRKNRPYNQIIRISNFSKNAKDIIINTIANNNVYISELLNKKLPENLYNELKARKIYLFPKSWNNLKSACSCSELGFPCKHISAIFHLIANEIDKNPFLVFILNNIDIVSELKNFGKKINSNNISGIISFKNIIQKYELEINDNSIKKLNINETLDNIDFSTIPDLNETLIDLLSDNPLFCRDGNFKKIMDKTYKIIKQKTNKLLENSNYFSYGNNQKKIFSFPLNEFSNLDYFLINENYNFKIKFNPETNKGIGGNSGLLSLMSAFNNINNNDIKQYSSKLNHLYSIYHFSLKLLQKGAFIPQLIMTSNKSYIIRWIPPLINDNIKNIYQRLSRSINTILIKYKSNIRNININPEQQLLIIISFFLNNIINLFTYKLNNENYINKLFFQSEKLKISKDFQIKEIPNTINLWLSRFYLSNKKYVPIIKIESFMKEYFIDILIQNKNDKLSAPMRLSEIFKKKNTEYNTTEILKDLNLLSDYLPEINKIIKSHGKEILKFNSIDFTRIFFKILPSIKMLGIKVLLPNELSKVIKPKLTISISKSKGSSSLINYMSLEDVLSFKWKISLGDKIISTSDFKGLVRGFNGIVKIRDQFVYINEKEINEILKNIENEPKLDISQQLRLGIEEEYDGCNIEIDNEAKAYYKSLYNEKEIKIPEKLQATLRCYQERGYKWLYKNIKYGFGCIIADDMGLGKTIQLITLLLKLKEENKFNEKKALIILPTTLLTNWQKEIIKFAPSLNIVIYHGKSRCLELDNIDIILTTYGIVRNEIKTFSNIEWQLLILDEAQCIKNPNSNQTKSIKKLSSKNKIALTGTPVENRLTEIWSIFDFINKGYLGNLKYFKNEFAIPIEVFRNSEKLKKFKTLTSPFLLRRVKTDKNIIKDLPEKIEIDELCNMTTNQTALYQNLVNKSLNKIEDKEGIERKGLILKLMVGLKQICNHPSHYLKQNDLNPELSGKTMMLLNLLEKIYLNNEKVLIFTQYKQMGDLLKKIIFNNFKTNVNFLNGSIPRNKRDILISEFQNNKDINTLIITLQAGGTGLNLTAASNVIHFDLWWNPAIENQATDRAYRIGQKTNVMVYRLLTKGTLEEKINEMIKAKKELANLTISNGELSVSELSNNDLKKIINLEEEKSFCVKP